VTRTCTVCGHPQRHAIEKLIVGGTANRRIATQFQLSEAAVRRHKDEHLPVALVKAVEVEELRQALDVLQQLRHINGAALTVLRDAKTAEDGELMLKAIDRVHRQIELQAKLLGDLDDRPVINVLVTPEWQTLRETMLRALAPFPAARLAVAAALQAQETA